ncbi:MAG TPA: DUF1080 domain-containing protein [Sedimentisphaerales bacterium]|nr:DUF1080 domain-containing protein [Sedimentisphaerales bacterium]
MFLKMFSSSVFLINERKFITCLSLLILSVLLSSCAGPLAVDPVIEARDAIESADAAMGDWEGNWKLKDESDSGRVVTQVIALGKGNYRAKVLEEFDTREEPMVVLEGRRDGAAVRFEGQAELSDGGTLEIKAAIENGKLNGSFEGDEFGSIALNKVIRVSPTLGAEPPAGAIVLFNGKNFKQWKHTNKKPGADSVKWSLVKGGAMEVVKGTGSIVTKKKFTDLKLHVEFRTPFMSDARGQARGNSGVYLQERYEVQVLDSYALEGEDNECGGIYKIGAPLVNMCAPPTQWQTYDITFYTPGADRTNAQVTIVHNGVTIHDQLSLPKPTGGALDSDVTKAGGIYLQDHGNPVQYRNIWLIEL